MSPPDPTGSTDDDPVVTGRGGRGPGGPPSRGRPGVPARDARVLLLSDCVCNAGPDPRTVAGRLPRLDVLLDVSGERDVDLGRDLARLGRGRLRLVRDSRDVPAALGAVFAG